MALGKNTIFDDAGEFFLGRATWIYTKGMCSAFMTMSCGMIVVSADGLSLQEYIIFSILFGIFLYGVIVNGFRLINLVEGRAAAGEADGDAGGKHPSPSASIPFRGRVN